MKARRASLRLLDNRLNRDSDWDMERRPCEVGGPGNLENATCMVGFIEDDLKRLGNDIDEVSLRRIAAGYSYLKPVIRIRQIRCEQYSVF